MSDAVNYVFRTLAVLKWYLLIFSDRIFDSNVDRLIPSFAAAPDGPDTRPPLLRRVFPYLPRPKANG